MQFWYSNLIFCPAGIIIYPLEYCKSYKTELTKCYEHNKVMHIWIFVCLLHQILYICM